MTKVYFRNSGSAESAMYIEYAQQRAKMLIAEALNEYRIVVNTTTNQRVFDVSWIMPKDVLRVYPIVGGG